MGRTWSTWPKGGPSGPYKVLERGNKAWKLQVGERVEVVSTQQGPLEAPLGQRGFERGCAANTWEAEDGLSSSSGFLFFNREARGACVADTRHE